MRRAALALLFAVGALASAQDFPLPGVGLEGPIFSVASMFDDDDFAFFEFAPEGGAGMGSECACTTPTGAKGEALTYSRTGTAACTKGTNGLRTTSIATGDLVKCSANQPRVMKDSNGVLGLLVEATRTNYELRSEELDNAAYSNSAAGGGATPTLNGANAAAAPDGTTTAEDYTFGATTASQTSGRFGTAAIASCAGVTCTSSIYVKGVSGSGTMDVCVWETTAPDCSPCAFVSTSWSRCTASFNNAGNVRIGFGNFSLYNGGTARDENRVYVWGAQTEVGATVSSYTPTVSASAARGAETPYFAVSTAGLQAQGCAYGSAARPSGATQGTIVFFDSAGRPIYWNTTQRVYDGTTEKTLTNATQDGTAKKYRAKWSASTMYLSNTDNAEQSAAFDGTMGAAPSNINVGGSGTTGSADGIISRVMVDPDPSRCPAP